MAEIVKNRFLEAVRTRTGLDLAARCEHVSLRSAAVLFEPETPARYVHFITSGVASVVATMKSGNAVETAMFGNEGFPETMHLLGPDTGTRRCVMQIAGSALRMSFSSFKREFHDNVVVRELALQLIQAETLTVAQVAACNGLHEVEDRLARWLLMVQDRIRSPELPLTQEFIGDMLGTRRATVSITAANLQRAGMIEYRRGFIRVERRDRLEDVECECYRVIRKIRDSLYR